MLICLPVSLTSVSMVISTFFSKAGHSIVLCFFMAEGRCFMSMYPIFLICSSVLLHLSCSVSLPRHMIASSEGTSLFCFLRTSILFSLADLHYTFPTTVRENSLLSSLSLALIFGQTLRWPFWPVWGWTLLCVCVRISDDECVLMCLITVCMSSSKKYPSLFGPFVSWVVCVFYIELYELSVCFRDEFLVGIFICKCFFPFWVVIVFHLGFPLLYKCFMVN